MTKEELIALVESQKDVYGIKSFSLEDRYYSAEVKRGYESAAAAYIKNLIERYPDLIQGGNTKTE